MLPSAGFFAKIHCPLFRQGFCERPFCPYKHAKDERELTSSHRPPFARAAGPARIHVTASSIVHHSSTVSFEKDPCLLELERINKEIETVKCEVEREQRRLSHYRSLQGDADGKREVLIPYNDSVCKGRNALIASTFHPREPSAARPGVGKYVIDNCKPRTDLEYDPLSNYSAAVRSCGAVERKPRLDDVSSEKRGVKRARETREGDGSKGLPAEPEDSDDGVLVIDVPPLENKRKNRRPPKPSRPLPDVLVDGTPAAVPAVNASVPAQSCKAEGPAPDPCGTPSGSSNSPPSAGLAVNQGSEAEEPPSHNVFEDIAKCLETLRSESEKMISLPKMGVVSTDKSSNSSASSPSSFPSSVCKNPPSQQNGKFNTSPQVIKHELIPSGHRKSSSSTNLAEGDQGILPLSLNSSSHFQHNDQKGASTVEGYWLPVQRIPLPCLQKQVEHISRPDFTEVVSMPSANPKHNDHPESTADLINLVQGPSVSEVPQQVVSEVNLFDVSRSPQVHGIGESAPRAEASCGEEMDYSDADMSDSDPMEECYRIFMEANQEPGDQLGNAAAETLDSEKQEAKPPFLLSGPKKRVAHVSKRNEVNRSKPQVIVPEGGPATHLSHPSRIQQLRQEAAVLTSAIRGGSAFAAAQKKPVTLAPVTLAPVSQPMPVQTTCFNILPVGAAIQHFLIQEKKVALPVTAVPVRVVPPQPAAPNPSKVPPPLSPNTAERNKRNTPPVAVKRRPKSRPEPENKVPHDTRQRYINLFVEEFLKTSFTLQDAFEKALAEEKMVYDRSMNTVKYQSVAVNSLKRLKNQNASVKGSTVANAQGRRGKINITTVGLQTNGPGVVTLYKQLKAHVLSEAAMWENGYPLGNPENPGSAVLRGEGKKGSTDPTKRICCRCGATFSVNQSGMHVRKEECNYHYGKVVANKVPGGMETRYSCCEGVIGTPGCQVFKLHVHDAISLDGFVSSVPKALPGNGSPGVFAVDCVMCYTTHGLELARVTVVNPSLHIIYDTFVKPDHEVIDYNTRFSGVSEEDLKGSSTSIRDVQEVLQSFVSADTILIGHGLEKDLLALKFLHSSVVDLTVVFPHRLGLPHKRGLRSLTADYLRRIIQESVQGRDSAEEAIACMELMLWKVKEDAKVKRW